MIISMFEVLDELIAAKRCSANSTFDRGFNEGLLYAINYLSETFNL